MKPLRLGMIPLTDCAILAVAEQKGYFRRHGVEVVLSRETSWASLRDKVAAGALDGAQMLAGMPIDWSGSGSVAPELSISETVKSTRIRVEWKAPFTTPPWF